MSKETKGGVRWTILAAATDFGVARETLNKLLKQSDAAPGPDGCYSTRQVHAALAGDLKAEKIKLTREQTRKIEIDNRESEGRLIDADGAADIALRSVFACRQIIILSKLTLEEKNAMLAELRALAEIDWRNLKGYEETEE